MLDPDRYFSNEPGQRQIARQLFETVAGLPIISPHGHVDPKLFVDEKISFGSPADLLIIPDHYVFRMLYSQGYSLESLGVPRRDGGAVETDHRKIWQIFAENFYLFRGTPSGAWLNHELVDVLGISEKVCGKTAGQIYDQIEEKLALPEYQPRALFERFNIEVLCTTDSATDTLETHSKIKSSGWKGDIRPTFRPDSVTNLMHPGWRREIDKLSIASNLEILSFPQFLQALRSQRVYFKRMGATATDHAALSAKTGALTETEVERIFQSAMAGYVTECEAENFTAHMLMEYARMSLEDGLVMQIHVGARRNHNQLVYERFGADKGADIPVQVELTTNLLPLLRKFGSEPDLTIIIFNMDETTYSRELAPLAGHYPALKIGPPWWFHDSVNGMRRFFEQVMETAGIYNTVGFNDDTRAFPSIPARHDVWRRASANWLAGMVVTGVIDEEDAGEMVIDLAYNLAKKAYRLEGAGLWI